jgi:hypothetical protein
MGLLRLLLNDPVTFILLSIPLLYAPSQNKCF